MLDSFTPMECVLLGLSVYSATQLICCVFHEHLDRLVSFFFDLFQKKGGKNDH